MKSRFCAQIDKRWQHLRQSFERFAAMTYRRLGFLIDLPESFSEGRKKKQRVITETVPACGSKGNSSFAGLTDRPVCRAVRFWRADRESANKPPGSFLLGNSSQFVKQFFIIFFVVAFI